MIVFCSVLAKGCYDQAKFLSYHLVGVEPTGCLSFAIAAAVNFKLLFMISTPLFCCF